MLFVTAPKTAFDSEAMPVRGSAVVKVLCYKPEGGEFKGPDEVNEFLPIYLILPAALGHGVHSAFNRHE
jgi:hypothetical protein